VLDADFLIFTDLVKLYCNRDAAKSLDLLQKPQMTFSSAAVKTAKIENRPAHAFPFISRRDLQPVEKQTW
jgi:hypothetical protein